MATDNGTTLNDIILGSGLSDLLFGPGGNDFLDGQSGQGMLDGGAGSTLVGNGSVAIWGQSVVLRLSACGDKEAWPSSFRQAI
jgi:hypothetical protein